MDGTILIADDDRSIRTVLSQAYTRAGCQVHATSSLTTLMRWVGEGRGDLVITDVMMPDGNGIEMLPKIEKDRPELPVIVISAQNSIMTAIRASEAKAYDYLPKPFDLNDLLRRSARALDSSPKRDSRSETKDGDSWEGLELIGRAPIMQALYARVAKLLPGSEPLAITGPSGTGKTLLAETLHRLSDRSNEPILTADPAVLEQGDAFTQLIARARSGVLIFDQIEEYSEPLQLRIRRVFDQSLDGKGPRLIITAQQPLTTLIQQNRIRGDLGWRFTGTELQLPPLSERREDIAPLAEHFLQSMAGEKIGPKLSQAALDLLKTENWEGNIRELANLLRSLASSETSGEISAEAVSELIAPMPKNEPDNGQTAIPSPSGTLSENVKAEFEQYFARFRPGLPPEGLYMRVLKEIERPLIETTLYALKGNQLRTARLLGLNRNTLRKKITELEIDVARRRDLS